MLQDDGLVSSSPRNQRQLRCALLGGNHAKVKECTVVLVLEGILAGGQGAVQGHLVDARFNLIGGKALLGK